MALTVEQLMTPYPIVVDVATPLAQCARLMDDRDIGALGVMREGNLVGVLTDRDVVTRAVARDKVVSVSADAPVEEAERRMLARAVRRLFVLGDDGRPIGILTLDDLVALREPNSIVASQIREWGLVRGDQGYLTEDG